VKTCVFYAPLLYDYKITELKTLTDKFTANLNCSLHRFGNGNIVLTMLCEDMRFQRLFSAEAFLAHWADKRSISSVHYKVPFEQGRGFERHGTVRALIL